MTGQVVYSKVVTGQVQVVTVQVFTVQLLQASICMLHSKDVAGQKMSFSIEWQRTSDMCKTMLIPSMHLLSKLCMHVNFEAFVSYLFVTVQIFGMQKCNSFPNSALFIL